MSAVPAIAPRLTPYCGVVGEATLGHRSFALVECGPARLSRDEFSEVIDALKGGGGSFWRDQKVWIVPVEGLPKVAAALARAFPVAAAA